MKRQIKCKICLTISIKLQFHMFRNILLIEKNLIKRCTKTTKITYRFKSLIYFVKLVKKIIRVNNHFNLIKI